MSKILRPPDLSDAAGFDPYYKWLAINPKEQPPNYYRLLGVSLFESDPDVIANAADARMAHVKTFQTGSHSALSQRILNEIALAKVCLLNPQQRSEYDQQLRGRLDAGKPESPPCDPAPAAVVVPTSIYSLPRRKKLPDMVFGLSLLGVAAIVLAVILPVYWGRKQNDAPFAPKSTTADRPVSKLGRQKPRPEAKLRMPKPSVSRARASKKPRAVAQQNTRQPRFPKVQPLAKKPVPNSGSPDSSPMSRSASRKLAEKNPADVPTADLADLVERVKLSIVQIETEDGLGSGFVIDESGLIVTNYHVIHGATRAMAKFSNGLSVEIEGYVAADKRRDLAILCIKTKEKLNTIPIRSELPRQGESVIAIGSPRGLEFTVSEGIVSAIRTDFQPKVWGRDYDPGITWVQTTAAISPGNSGGPLVPDQF